MKFRKTFILNIICLSSLIHAAYGGEICCGKKITESDLTELRNVSEYIGTEARGFGSDSSKYLAIRHYKHKILDIDIIWTEDKNGFIQQVALSEVPKTAVDTYKGVKFKDKLVITYSTNTITIKKL